MSERTVVQDPMLKYAHGVGWTYVPPDEALKLREGEAGLFFLSIFEEKLLKLNSGILNQEQVGEIVRALTLLRPTIEGNRDILAWLRGEQSVFVPSERRHRNIKLIDFENPGNNCFQVTDEWWHKSTAFRNRADVVFLINGIPVAIAETKGAEVPQGLAKGVDQIRRYHRETPEMLLAPQVFEVTQLLDFYYGATWSTTRKDLFNWREEQEGDYERKVKAFFDRTRFLKVLRDYIIFLSRDDQLQKIILRQHQTRAVEKVLTRAQDPDKFRGLIWHTQGSGKTLTMITIASRLLRGGVESEKPTVLMLVDRNELEANLFKNIASYGLPVEVAQSKQDLQRILGRDYRGLVVSMIHKFEGVPADLNKRRSIIVLVDEAHRTTGGDLGNYLMAALPNASYIGFTGTPIDNLSKGKGTFKIFGYEDEEGYLDKYSIAESIKDGTTVQLNYALAPSCLRVDRETLERQFLDLAAAEGMSDQEELNAILDRAVELKEMMKAKARVEKIAAYVAKDFLERVEPMGFKAFLVAVDREACALYKSALDRYLPPEYSRVVYSPAHNDSPQLKEYYLSEDDEAKVRRDFAKKKELPKILIVTEKLLTGYDAPILYCMYLDKPMRDHVLLQAIARVNRPYEDDEGQVKPVGYVLDFVGIFEKLEKALAFDSDVVSSVIQNVDVLKDTFSTLMRDQAPRYLPFAQGWDDKAKERAIVHFDSREEREAFFKFFKQLQNLYDILSPDAFLRPFMKAYQELAELYALVKNAYSTTVYVDRELTAKTKELLRDHTVSGRLEPPGAIHTLGPKELEALKDDDTSDTVKILNLTKLLLRIADEEGGYKPFVLSIGERAEALAKAYEERQKSTQEALAGFEQLAREYVQAEDERSSLGANPNAYAIFTTLKVHAPELTIEQAQKLDDLFMMYPNYLWNEREQNELRGEFYQVLRPLVGRDRYVKVTNALLKLKRV